MKYGLCDNTIKQICDILHQYDSLESAILYGSRAKGNYREGSDIDLTFKGKNLNLIILNRISNQLDDTLLPYKFDVSIFNMIQNPDILNHIQRVGIVFYEK